MQRQFNSAANIMFLLRISDVMEEHVNALTRIALQESLLTRAETVWGVREASSRGCVVKGGKFLESMAAADITVTNCQLVGPHVCCKVAYV